MTMLRNKVVLNGLILKIHIDIVVQYQSQYTINHPRILDNFNGGVIYVSWRHFSTKDTNSNLFDNGLQNCVINLSCSLEYILPVYF
jgi:hypothetical protein